MFDSKKAGQNKFIARQMRKFFDGLQKGYYADPARGADAVAKGYGKFILVRRNGFLEDKKTVGKSKYYVGLSTNVSDFADLTKRSILVTDTLLLSHGRTGKSEIVCKEPARRIGPRYGSPASYLCGREFTMQCPDFDSVGRWLLNSEPLLRAGLAWHLPQFRVTQFSHKEDLKPEPDYDHDAIFTAFDYLVRDRRAVDLSGATPEKSALVRPILQIDLPFIEGVDLPTFGKITIDEFEAYLGFRRFLRQQFLNLDQSVNAVQSQRELDKIGLDIEDQVHAMKAEMNRIRRKRAVAASGACVGTATTILAAVYGPAFKEAIQMLGASGGAWGLLTAIAENSPRKEFRENKWYYVWVLQRKASRL